MNIAQLLGHRPVLLLDGAMGTQLDEQGLMSRGRNNLDAPQAVLAIHQAYVQCGCDAVTTNTLTMNRLYIETHNVGVSVEEINRAGVSLADQAVCCGHYILGNLSSTGQLLQPYGSYSEDQFYTVFKEQAEILAAAGVDALLIETMFDLREALCALRACRESSTLPVLVSLAFQTADKEGRTMMGDTAAQCAEQLTEAGAAAVGTNCGDLDPSQMAQIVAYCKVATDLPIIAQPNAGKPKLVDGQTVFDMAPEPFARGIAECIEAGAQIVGGCCGTTPDHIRAVRQIIKTN